MINAINPLFFKETVLQFSRASWLTPDLSRTRKLTHYSGFNPLSAARVFDA
jgi:hypothetical protein